MINIVVCDDDKSCVDQVERILLANKESIGTNVNIHKFINSENLCEYVTSNRVDQLYLDIEMPKISGIEIADYIRNKLKDYKMIIIFMTGTTQYDRLLFEFQTFAFLEKPIEEVKLIDICTKAYRINSNESKAITFSTKNCKYNVLLKDIVYMQKESHNLVIYTYNDGKLNYITVRGTIKEMNDMLPTDKFIRLSSSIIVGIEYIKSINRKEATLINGQVFSVSREFGKEAIIKYGRYTIN